MFLVSFACTISASTVTFANVGTCVIDANQVGNANYNPAAQVQQTPMIGKASGAIMNFAATPSNPAYSAGGTFTLSATGSGSTAPINYASTTPTVCTVSGSTVTMVSAGTCHLTADQVGDGNYNDALQVELDVTVGLASQSIAFASPGDQNLTQYPQTLAVDPFASSGLPITLVSTTPSTCSVGASGPFIVTLISTGVCTLVASQAGDANYAAATPVSVTFALSIVVPTPILDQRGFLLMSLLLALVGFDRLRRFDVSLHED